MTGGYCPPNRSYNGNAVAQRELRRCAGGGRLSPQCTGAAKPYTYHDYDYRYQRIQLWHLQRSIPGYVCGPRRVTPAQWLRPLVRIYARLARGALGPVVQRMLAPAMYLAAVRDLDYPARRYRRDDSMVNDQGIPSLPHSARALRV